MKHVYSSVNKLLKNKTIQCICFVLIFAFISFFTYKNTILLSPQGRHAWSQSDHYAIALNYADDLNFFKPRTYLLSPYMVPPPPELNSFDGITKADSPLSEYISGVIMKVTGIKEPFIYRFLTLLISLIGLFSIFKLMIKNTCSFFNSILVPFFIFSLPIYMYYQTALSPSVSAVAICFIGYFFYFSYLKTQKYSHFIFACLFFYIAILFRLPLGIAFIAVICQQLFSYFKNKKIEWKEVFVFILILILVISFFLYNQYIEKTYGSIFLSELKYPNSWEHFKELTCWVWNYKSQHLHTVHYLFLLILFLNLIAFVIFTCKKHKQLLSSFQSHLLIQIIITLVGGYLYFLLMMEQFRYHDYYVIETFLISFCLLLCFLSSFINWPTKWINYVIHIILSVLIIIGVLSSAKIQKSLLFFSPNDGIICEREQYISDIKYLIKKHHISKDQIICIAEGDLLPANIVFCNIQQKGYWGIGIENSDYILLSEKNLTKDLFERQPTYRNKLEYIDKHNTIILLKYHKDDIPDEKTYKLESFPARCFSFDSNYSLFKINHTFTDSTSTPKTGLVLKDDTFPLSLNIPSNILQDNNIGLAIIEMDILPTQETIDLQIILQLKTSKDETLYWFPQSFTVEKQNNMATSIKQVLAFPKVSNAEFLNISIENPNKNEFNYSNLKIYIY